MQSVARGTQALAMDKFPDHAFADAFLQYILTALLELAGCGMDMLRSRTRREAEPNLPCSSRTRGEKKMRLGVLSVVSRIQLLSWPHRAGRSITFGRTEKWPERLHIDVMLTIISFVRGITGGRLFMNTPPWRFIPVIFLTTMIP